MAMHHAGMNVQVRALNGHMTMMRAVRRALAVSRIIKEYRDER
jgi:hypothetical protein